jgi:Lipocalin-like domain
MTRRALLLSSVALSMCSAFADHVAAQTAKYFVGTWTMVSAINVRPDGTKVDLFGPKGKGQAIFEADGYFNIINVNPDTPKFVSNNRVQGTPEENKAAVLGSIALFGTYSLLGKVVALKVTGCTYPNWTGTEQKRNISRLAKDEFTWTFAAAVGGTHEYTWRRIK